MAATTYCQSCYRILHVPEETVGRKLRCTCGNSFRVEKSLAQIQEEERQVAYRRRGVARLQAVARRRLGRPQYRRGPFTSTLTVVLGALAVLLYAEAAFHVPEPTPPPTYTVRLLYAPPERPTAEIGTSLRDPVRPPDLPGLTEPTRTPGEGEPSQSPEMILASSEKPKRDREGARERGKWRLVPERAKKAWKTDGLDLPRDDASEDPDEVTGVGTPSEGAPVRPNPPDEKTNPDGMGQKGSDPELEALERIARSADGGGTKFFGSPIPLDADGIVFIMDRSASMVMPASPPEDAARVRSSWTKLDLAKWELKKAIALLPADMKFNVIFFDNCLHRWRYVMQEASPRAKREVYRWIENSNNPQGQTNISAAVVAALEHEGKNRIVLLSDGRPNVIDCRTETDAPPNDEDESVSCFSFSDDAESEDFLRQLAAITGGEFSQLSTRRH